MSLYYMHHFGSIRDAKTIFKTGKDSTSLVGSTTLSRSNKRANGWLVKKNIKTVGDMKRGLQKILDDGYKALGEFRDESQLQSRVKNVETRKLTDEELMSRRARTIQRKQAEALDKLNTK